MNMELRWNGKKVENATWADVEAVLPELKEEGSFRLTIWPQHKTGTSLLDVQSENGNYMPSMLVAGERGVRVFVNPEGRDKDYVSIGGYQNDAMALTQDFDLVVRMIKEFYDTGDVSKDLLK